MLMGMGYIDPETGVEVQFDGGSSGGDTSFLSVQFPWDTVPSGGSTGTGSGSGGASDLVNFGAPGSGGNLTFGNKTTSPGGSGSAGTSIGVGANSISSLLAQLLGKPSGVAPGTPVMNRPGGVPAAQPATNYTPFLIAGIALLGITMITGRR